MLEPIPDLPEGVIGFEAVGEVHADDYADTLIPAIEAVDGPVRLVYVLGDRFTGYSAGAAWQDAKLGIHHHGRWHRAAVVSDAGWVRHLASVFGWMVPGKFEVFPLDQREAAIAWAASD
ncbi:MAG: STAS/SEC14 domain-containing protein [Acidimicrobiia bacterium]